MTDSPQVQEWIAEGQAKGLLQGQANALLRVLARRFPPGAGPEMESAIRATADLQRLEAWLDAAATAASLDAFRHAAGL